MSVKMIFCGHNEALAISLMPFSSALMESVKKKSNNRPHCSFRSLTDSVLAYLNPSVRNMLRIRASHILCVLVLCMRGGVL